MASQESLTQKLIYTGKAKEIVIFFLAGVLVQILTAFLYKYALWMLHLGEINQELKQTRRYKSSLWFYLRLWPTVAFDLSTIILFAWPTFAVLSASLR